MACSPKREAVSAGVLWEEGSSFLGSKQIGVLREDFLEVMGKGLGSTDLGACSSCRGKNKVTEK